MKRRIEHPTRLAPIAAAIVILKAASTPDVELTSSPVVAGTRGTVSDTNYLLLAAEGMHKVVILACGGRIQWEYPAEMSRDAWRLPGGNVLFCYNPGIITLT